METDLAERVVLVTGSSSGIGRAIAHGFGAEGARVAVTYHSDERGAANTAAEISELGGDARTVQYDLLDDASIGAAIRSVVDEWGRIDVLVNNAVVWARTSPGDAPAFEDVAPADWRRLVRGNLEGAFLATQRVVPHMRENGWGRLVFVSSNLVRDGLPGSAPYAAAKAGLHGLSNTLAAELAPEGILTNVVLPGMTLTERGRTAIPPEVREAVAAETPTGRLTTPADVANLVVFLGSDRNGHVNGEAIPVTGGI